MTLRESTERPITVTEGTDRTAPGRPTAEGIIDTVDARCALPEAIPAEFGVDG